MTLYIDRGLSDADSQTHIFLIAVNDYPHLIGGSGTPALKAYGQGQLTTPVHSALKIANWFEAKLHNPAAPLGTIEMVLSPGTAPAPAVDIATLPNIEAAFKAWYTRCAKNSQNVAWFYFCGHGLESINSVNALLASDYGADPLNPWTGAFDFRAMFLNLADWVCSKQIFVIDACRTPIPDPVYGISALKGATATSFPSRDAPVFRGTSVSNSALGPANAPSFFSEALVDCLDKLAASHFDGIEWVVTTNSLGGALLNRMDRTVDNGVRRPLACDIAGGVQNPPSAQLHSIAPSDAHVMSEIFCDLTAAEDDATLEALAHSQLFKANSMGQTRPWRPTLPVDVYDINGTLVSGSVYTSIQSSLAARAAPPLFTRKLKVLP